jgi:hypothetical protein
MKNHLIFLLWWKIYIYCIIIVWAGLGKTLNCFESSFFAINIFLSFCYIVNNEMISISVVLWSNMELFIYVYFYFLKFIWSNKDGGKLLGYCRKTANFLLFLEKIAGNQDKFDLSISELNQMYASLKYNP